MDLGTVEERAAALMPGLLEELSALVAIPSVAFPGFPSEPVHRMARAVLDLAHRSGAETARLLDVPGGYPAVFVDLAGPPGAPTVLLYAHYDVQPAPPEQGWTSDPWTAVRREDGRVYGRGAADCISGILVHAGTLQVLAGERPVRIKLVVEGEEEVADHLQDVLDADPEPFAADVFVVADMGNPAVGVPALTTALRGCVECTVDVRTLDHPAHSGLFGGAAPDALVALVRILAGLHDDRGNVAVPGLTSFPWVGGDVDEAAYRRDSGLLDGVDLVGDSTLASRLWSRPSVTVTGLDAPRVATASNVLIPEATAKVSMRIAPGADPHRELRLLTEHLRRSAPWNVRVEVREGLAAAPVAVPEDGRGVAEARRALTEAYGRPAGAIGTGGSIPLVAALRRACPDAGVVIWGAQDVAGARIHASDESVHPDELRRMIVTQARLLTLLGGAG